MEEIAGSVHRFDAERNLALLAENEYPGRGIVVVRWGVRFIFDCEWIGGRSDPSRNRRFGEERPDGSVWTEVADENKPAGDSAMTIYPALLKRTNSRLLVVGNGDQTNDAMRCGGNLYEAMRHRTYEPDGTPRITASVRMNRAEPKVEMSILRRSCHGDGCDPDLWCPSGWPLEHGYCLTTYEGDGKPLPFFSGQPYLLPFVGDSVEELVHFLWDHLTEPNRVAIVGRLTNIETFESVIYAINKYPKVAKRE